MFEKAMSLFAYVATMHVFVHEIIKKTWTVSYFIIQIKLNCIYFIQCGPTVCTVSQVSLQISPITAQCFICGCTKLDREFCRFTKPTLTSLGTGLYILWKC